MREHLTFAATVVFFAGAGFLVTPVGFAALVVVVFGPRLAPVLAVARFFGTTGSATDSKILGLELPVYMFSHVRVYAPQLSSSADSGGQMG